MSAHTARAATAPGARRTGIPLAALIAGGAPGARGSAADAMAAIAQGLREAGRPEPDTCPLDDGAGGRSPRDLLDALGFEPRMRRARALVILDRRLAPSTLAGSLAFELATRARQAGVPAYAVTGENRLDQFAARILDLQLIIRARGPRELRAAGRTLGEVL